MPGRTFRPGRCGADTVDIVFRILGEIVVNDMTDVLDVDAPRGHVGGDKDLDSPVLELLHQFQALALGQISGNAGGRIPVTGKLLRHVFHSGLGVDKDEHTGPVLTIEQTKKQRQFFIPADMQQALVNTLHGDVFRGHGDEFGQVHEVIGEFKDPVGQGGGKEHGLSFLVMGEFFQDIAQVLDESQVEEAVGFVDDQGLNAAGMEDLLFHEVNEPTRGADDDIRAFTKGVGLFLVIHAADDREDAEISMLSE